MKSPADLKLILNQPFTLPQIPPQTPQGALNATVIGLDRYSFINSHGETHHWESYTLAAASPAPYDRFWVANVPGHGAYVFTRAQTPRPATARYNETLSGLCRLESHGDAALSSAFSALNCWQEEDGTIHSLEIFSAGAPIAFRGAPLPR